MSFRHAIRKQDQAITRRNGNVLLFKQSVFERAQYESGDYVRWFIEHAFVVVPAQAIVAQHLVSFQQFPPRQRPGSFSVEQALEKLRLPPSSN